MEKNEGRERRRLDDSDFKRERGRPKGSIGRMSRETREAARETGALPHELLLQWSRGEPMSRKVPPTDGSDATDLKNWTTQYIPVDEDIMTDSAKAAAPYYAPKLSTVEVIAGVSDADLDDFITRAAAEAGASVSFGGEGKEDTQPD